MKHINNLQSNIFDRILANNIMESKLIVRNFGPIKEVDLNLKNVNVFIGPQATGKSALAKLFTIFKAPRKFFFRDEGIEKKRAIIDTNLNAFEEVREVFEDYNIGSFLNPNTEVEFESELHKITYSSGVLKYEAKFRKQIHELEILANDFYSNRAKLVAQFDNLASKFILFDIRANAILYPGTEPTLNNDINWEDLTETNCKDLFEIIKPIEDNLSTSAAIYIPAERNFVNIIKKSALNLILNKVPIPQHILTFGAELEKLSLNEIDLGFIHKDLKYKNVNGEDKIYIAEDKIINLTEAASGIQSVVPLLAFTLQPTPLTHRSFVIEEPELNLFPLAQYDLIKFLESKRKDPFGLWEDYGTIHTYTTHSPYILSSLNNLLYASKVLKYLNSKISDNISNQTRSAYRTQNDIKVKGIVKATLNPAYFTAYQICNGLAKPIFNMETGLIEDNFIDDSTDKINDDFAELMELMK